jgi:hypothetical protein
MLWPFLLALSAQSAGADAEQSENDISTYIIADVAADKSRCNQGNAKRIGLEVLAARPSDLVHECVVVSGFLRGSALFLSRSESRMEGAGWNRELQGRRLGVYGLDKAASGLRLKPGMYDVVGIVGDCDRLSANVGMVMGYCHSADGFYVAASEVRRAR